MKGFARVLSIMVCAAVLVWAGEARALGSPAVNNVSAIGLQPSKIIGSVFGDNADQIRHASVIHTFVVIKNLISDIDKEKELHLSVRKCRISSILLNSIRGLNYSVGRYPERRLRKQYYSTVFSSIRSSEYTNSVHVGFNRVEVAIVKNGMRGHVDVSGGSGAFIDNDTGEIELKPSFSSLGKRFYLNVFYVKPSPVLIDGRPSIYAVSSNGNNYGDDASAKSKKYNNGLDICCNQLLSSQIVAPIRELGNAPLLIQISVFMVLGGFAHLLIGWGLFPLFVGDWFNRYPWGDDNDRRRIRCWGAARAGCGLLLFALTCWLVGLT